MCGFQVTSLVNFMVWSASSLVGVRIRALAPVWAWGPFSLSNMGTKNAAVFPLPVLAMATTSLPSRMTGIVCQNKHQHNEQVTRHSRQKWLIRCEGGTHLSLDRGWNIVALPHDPFIDRIAKTYTMGKTMIGQRKSLSYEFDQGLQMDIPMDWKPPDFFFFLFCARTISLVSGSTSDRQSEEIGKRGSFFPNCEEPSSPMRMLNAWLIWITLQPMVISKEFQWWLEVLRNSNYGRSCIWK